MKQCGILETNAEHSLALMVLALLILFLELIGFAIGMMEFIQSLNTNLTE